MTEKTTSPDSLGAASCSESCEMDRIATGAACGKPAAAVWVCDEKRTRVCKSCSWTVSVCGGTLVDLSPNA